MDDMELTLEQRQAILTGAFVGYVMLKEGCSEGRAVELLAQLCESVKSVTHWKNIPVRATRQ